MLWPWVLRYRAARIAARLERQRTFRPGEPHGLNGELIVSLTSYPKRFPTLHLTIKSLLNQSLAADRTILWLSPGENRLLPPAVRDLQSDRFEIRVYPLDLRSYAKIIPVLEQHPDATVVTADDDLYYPVDWLKDLVEIARRDPKVIVCHRAHKPAYDLDGRLKPYRQWSWNVPHARHEPCLFPTGVGGVLYPPGILHPDAVDRAAFTALAPHADDAWLFFMGRLAGARYTKTPHDFHLVTWLGSQTTSLMQHNVDGDGNDLQLQALEDRYGLLGAPRTDRKTLLSPSGG